MIETTRNRQNLAQKKVKKINANKGGVQCRGERNLKRRRQINRERKGEREKTLINCMTQWWVRRLRARWSPLNRHRYTWKVQHFAARLWAEFWLILEGWKGLVCPEIYPGTYWFRLNGVWMARFIYGCVWSKMGQIEICKYDVECWMNDIEFLVQECFLIDCFLLSFQVYIGTVLSIWCS